MAKIKRESITVPAPKEAAKKRRKKLKMPLMKMEDLIKLARQAKKNAAKRRRARAARKEAVGKRVGKKEKARISKATRKKAVAGRGAMAGAAARRPRGGSPITGAKRKKPSSRGGKRTR
jgi:hypothetical protein